MVEFLRPHASEWVLEHQRADAAGHLRHHRRDVWLYVVIAPKGFLPLQDTGLITAVTEAGPTCRSPRCSACRSRSRPRSRQDPDVTGVVSVVGVGPVNPTPNAGRLVITLKAARRAARRRFRRDRAAEAAVASIPGMTVYFQPVQDIQIAPVEPRAVSVHADRHRRRRGGAVGRQAGRRSCAAIRCATSPRRRRKAACACARCRSRARRPARRLMQASTTRSTMPSAQRQISTIYGQANQYRVMLEAMPMYQRDPLDLLPTSSSRCPAAAARAASTQVPLSAVATLRAPPRRWRSRIRRSFRR
jgi:multidrug efflux pump